MPGNFFYVDHPPPGWPTFLGDKLFITVLQDIGQDALLWGGAREPTPPLNTYGLVSPLNHTDHSVALQLAD